MSDAKQFAAFQTLLLCIFIAMTGLGILSPIMPNYASELGATGIWIGLIFSGFSLSRAVMQTPVGRLADRSSKKRILCIGLAVYAFISLLYNFASTLPLLVVIRLIHGLGSAMVMPVAMAYAVNLTPRGKEGRYMGFMSTAMFLGFGTGPLLGGYIYDHFSFSTVFYSMAAIVTLSLLLTIIFVPDEEGLGMKKDSPRVPFMKILSNRRLLGALSYRFANALGRGGIMGFLSIFAYQVLGIPFTLIGTILAVGVFSSSLLQIPFGILADRYNRTILIMIGGSVASLGYFYLTLTESVFDLMAAQLIISAGEGVSLPAMSAVVAGEGKTLGAGSTMGVLNTAMSIGMFAGPLIAGAIMDAYSVQTSFSLAGVMGITGVVMFYLLTR